MVSENFCRYFEPLVHSVSWSLLNLETGIDIHNIDIVNMVVWGEYLF